MVPKFAIHEHAYEHTYTLHLEVIAVIWLDLVIAMVACEVALKVTLEVVGRINDLCNRPTLLGV